MFSLLSRSIPTQQFPPRLEGLPLPHTFAERSPRPVMPQSSQSAVFTRISWTVEADERATARAAKARQEEVSFIVRNELCCSSAAGVFLSSRISR